MRLVIDTNTAVSGLLWGGQPGKLIDACLQSRIELASSLTLLAELKGVLSRHKFAHQLIRRNLKLEDLFDGYAQLVLLVEPANIPATILRDPADDWVLATALAAKADLLVSGDAHLLDVKRFHGIEIVTASAALERMLG